MNDFTLFLVLGIIQGVLEWLPVSSSGNVTLLLVNLAHTPFSEAVKVSFFLHAGTMLSVIIKFRSRLFTLVKDILSVKHSPLSDFYITATVISAVVGIPLYLLLEVEISEKISSLLIAFFLVITGIVIRYQKKGLKFVTEIKIFDAVLVGAAQGLSVVPGISRSGMTMTTLLLRGINQEDALTLSFVLSIPPVLGLMILTFSEFQWLYVLSVVASFVCSFLSMEILLRMSRTLNFSYFCFAVAIITVLIVLLVD